MKKIIDIVKEIEAKDSISLEECYTGLLLIERDYNDLDLDELELNYDYDILCEGRRCDEDLQVEIKEAKKYIASKYPDYITYPIIEVSHFLGYKKGHHDLVEYIVDISTDVFADEEKENNIKERIQTVLESIKKEGHEFVYEFGLWGSEYDYDEVDITEHLWVSIVPHFLDNETRNLTIKRLEEAGCVIETY